VQVGRFARILFWAPAGSNGSGGGVRVPQGHRTAHRSRRRLPSRRSTSAALTKRLVAQHHQSFHGGRLITTRLGQRNDVGADHPGGGAPPRPQHILAQMKQVSSQRAWSMRWQRRTVAGTMMTTRNLPLDGEVREPAYQKAHPGKEWTAELPP